MSIRRHVIAVAAAAALIPAAVVSATGSATGEPARSAPGSSAADPAASSGSSASLSGRGPELSTTTRLADRRGLVSGDRAYAMSSEDGLYPAMGWHIQGEMAGVWAQPIKLLDGIWFKVGDQWLGKQAAAKRYTAGFGHTRIDYAALTGAGSGVTVRRTDVVPDGEQALLVGLTFSSDRARSVPLTMNAHSELMSSYPWGWTTPNQSTVNLQDQGASRDGSLVFTEKAGASSPLGAHEWAAVVRSDARATATRLGKDFRGPQDPAVLCADGVARCDDSTFGKGTGGEQSYTVDVRPGKPRTVWFTVAGSEKGVARATATAAETLRNPERLLQEKVRARQAVDERSRVSIPGDRQLEESVRWSKQNLADSAQEARDLKLRWTDEGKQLPAPLGTLRKARWLGAGWPDYPWMFGTDGEYTAFASVAMGDFENIEAHMRTIADISDQLNKRSGKVAHEIVPDGSIYYGENSSAGNTDETSKFPSAVALIWRWSGDDRFRDDLYDFTRRNMRYVVDKLDADHDGWPEGLGNVERPGMGEEKLDNAVYTIRGLRDLADLARSKGDGATRAWATKHADSMQRAFDRAWWMPGSAKNYADSLANPDNTRVFQRHWTGVTPMDAMLVGPGGSIGSAESAEPLAPEGHANTALDQRQTACFSGKYGLFHTGTGPTSAPGGNVGASCDDVVSAVPSERSEFSLNTAIMAVAEGNYGRMGTAQQQRYTKANAEIQLDPSVWEMPGAMPEIAPDADFKPNIDRPFTERSMVLQAWGAYGNLWPVIAQQLGVRPDLGRDRVAVVPLIPDGQHRLSGSDIRLGDGSADVTASRRGGELTTEVRLDSRGTRLTIGHTLRSGEKVRSVTLDGRRLRPGDYTVTDTSRGHEVTAQTTGGRHMLTVEVR